MKYLYLLDRVFLSCWSYQGTCGDLTEAKQPCSQCFFLLTIFDNTYNITNYKNRLISIFYCDYCVKYHCDKILLKHFYCHKKNQVVEKIKNKQCTKYVHPTLSGSFSSWSNRSSELLVVLSIVCWMGRVTRCTRCTSCACFWTDESWPSYWLNLPLHWKYREFFRHHQGKVAKAKSTTSFSRKNLILWIKL